MFAEGYAKARLYAKGRMKSGQMNRTEKAYAAFLEVRNTPAGSRPTGLRLSS